METLKKYLPYAITIICVVVIIITAICMGKAKVEIVPVTPKFTVTQPATAQPAATLSATVTQNIQTFTANPGDRFEVEFKIQSTENFHSVDFDVRWPAMIKPVQQAGAVAFVDGDLFSGKVYEKAINLFTDRIYVMKALQSGQSPESSGGSKIIGTILFEATASSGQGDIVIQNLKELRYDNSTQGYVNLAITANAPTIVFQVATIAIMTVTVRKI